MRMLVRLAFVPLVDMVVRAVLPGMAVVVDAFPRAVLMGMLVFVRMLVSMDMGMLVAVSPNFRMLVLMLVFMGVFMAVVMVVFVVAFHGGLLFELTIILFPTSPRRHVLFPYLTDNAKYCCVSLLSHTE